MILICCVDDHMGMSFHHRRQSQDRMLRQRILEFASGRLWMNRYSAAQFSDAIDQILVDDACLLHCPPGEYCFAEERPELKTAPEKVILYRWNRSYPADAYFDLPLSKWKLEHSEDLRGYSHTRITEEVYIR